MNTDSYSRAVDRLAEFGKAAAELERLGADRDQRIWDAHQAGVSKAEIGRITGLSWATVDRTVREMASQANGSSEEGQES